jgi:hypothetical protein
VFLLSKYSPSAISTVSKFKHVNIYRSLQNRMQSTTSVSVIIDVRHPYNIEEHWIYLQSPFYCACIFLCWRLSPSIRCVPQREYLRRLLEYPPGAGIFYDSWALSSDLKYDPLPHLGCRSNFRAESETPQEYSIPQLLHICSFPGKARASRSATANAGRSLLCFLFNQ